MAVEDEENENDNDKEIFPLVVDHGSQTCKVGFAGDDTPQFIVPTVIGRLRQPSSIMIGMDDGPFAGDHALAKRGVCTVTYPIEYGIITHWEEMEILWRHIFFQELKVDPTTQPILLTEPPQNPKANRERMSKLMFDTFHVPAIHIQNSATLAVYATRNITGCVVDVGDTVTYVASVYEGYIIPHSTIRMDTAGRDLTEHLQQLLNDRGCMYTNETSHGRDQLKEIKESLCYVAVNFDEEMEHTRSNRSFELQNGDCIQIDKERFLCPEVLFDPTKKGLKMDGIDMMVYQCILKCDVEIRNNLYSNIVVAGGSTLFRGFQDRLTNSITDLAPTSMDVNVVALPNRQYATWIGGSMIASLETFETMWITKEEYDESGPSIIHTKCY